MKLFIQYWFSLLFVCNYTYAQDAYKIKLLANYNNPNLPKVDGTDIWNDLTGYYNPINNKEYIICGSTDSIYFFEIGDTNKLKLVDVEHGKSIFARNRDFEIYKHYAYCVSDQASGIGALQIFDLQYLPDSVHKVYESNVLGTFTHTIFIDSVLAKMYMCTNLGQFGISAMDVISLADPVNPILHTRLKVPIKPGGFPLFNRVHEMYARKDTVYLSCEQSGLYIFNLKDSANHIFLGSITSYPDQGFNHSSWLNESGRFILFTDENKGLDMKIFDLENLGDPKFVSQFNSHPDATPHNAFWVGDLAYVSAYHDGLRIYNLKNPYKPEEVAWYDTHPVVPEQYGGYRGCWGVYPFLPSKKIIASDLTAGIFVFEVDSNLVGNEEKVAEPTYFSLFPNPSVSQINLHFSGQATGQYEVFNWLGSLEIKQSFNNNKFTIDVSHLPSGQYAIKVSTSTGNSFKKFIKQ
jgi:choice-of-anchor B domain-containing protein